ncbi:IS1 family transposase [Enterobacter sp. CPE_E222]|uniref:IS1 family transposase n=1 Tax=Enterobacter sp. CPE_E222 TaxID=3383890 RepID=UPI0039769A52
MTSIVCAEMDEQWGYVGAKSRQRWLFAHAIMAPEVVIAYGRPNALWRRWGAIAQRAYAVTL